MSEKLTDWFARTKTPVTVRYLAERYLVRQETVRLALKRLIEAGRVKRYRVGSKILYKGV